MTLPDHRSSLRRWAAVWRWWPLRAGLQTYDTDQPWVIYSYLSRDERTRLTGRSVIECECAVCGERKRLALRIPRVGEVVDRGKHPERIRFLLAHLHPDRPAPMAWARPLLNLAAHPRGLDLNALAMRLEADLAASDEEHSQ